MTTAHEQEWAFVLAAAAFELNISGRLRVAWIADPDGGAVQLVMKAPVAAAATK